MRRGQNARAAVYFCESKPNMIVGAFARDRAAACRDASDLRKNPPLGAAPDQRRSAVTYSPFAGLQRSKAHSMSLPIRFP